MKRKSDLSLKTRKGDAHKKEATAGGDGPQSGKGIRTRLSTGTLVMSGTSTASPAELPSQESLTLPSHASSVGSDVAATPSPSRKRKAVDNKELSESPTIPPKRKKIGRNDGTGEGNKNDYFCWICHKEGVMICCELCPRVFHAKCLSIENNVPQDWVCPECEKIMKAECTDTRSEAMKMITVSTLCTLLQYALNRMRTVGSETFEHPVDPAQFPNYSDYVFHPMSLSVLEKNIKRKNYGCTESFLADAKWIYHNSYAYNGAQNKITSVARALLKVCKHEMSEIEVCPDCYYSSCVQSNSDWFCEPCRNPHPLVWAKLKGYPFWPAKALREVNDQVDVRFFGAHDRSWVPVASCFMLSKMCPVIVKKGRGGMNEAMREVELHIKKLREKMGSFEYAPFRTPYSSDSVYSKMKIINTGGSIDSSKLAGLGKMAGKTKGAEGRQGDKQSMVSKTAMAVKSKYITLTSKKGAQHSGSAAKTAPSTQQHQRQIIYLKPMPKGVFILSEQTTEPLTGSASSQSSIARPTLPDLQLMKRISGEIQPVTLSSSSELSENSSQHIDEERGELPERDAVREEEQTASEEKNPVVGADKSKTGAVGEARVADCDTNLSSSAGENYAIGQDSSLAEKLISDLDVSAKQLNLEPECHSQSGIDLNENSGSENRNIQHLRPVEAKQPDQCHVVAILSSTSNAGVLSPGENVQKFGIEKPVMNTSPVVISSSSDSSIEQSRPDGTHVGDGTSDAGLDGGETPAGCREKSGSSIESTKECDGLSSIRMNSSAKVDENQEKSAGVSGDKDSNPCVSEEVLPPVETAVHYESVKSSIDSAENCQNISATSSTVVPTAASVTASAVTISPGSVYKENLQKVIDSCKAKLGLNNKSLSNTEDDAFIIGGDDDDDDEEEGIIVSDCDLDDDSDVLLMDIDDENDECTHSVPTNTSKKNCDKSSNKLSKNDIPDGNSKSNTQQTTNGKESTTREKVVPMPSSKNTSTAPVLESNSESTAKNLPQESSHSGKITDTLEDINDLTILDSPGKEKENDKCKTGSITATDIEIPVSDLQQDISSSEGSTNVTTNKAKDTTSKKHSSSPASEAKNTGISSGKQTMSQLKRLEKIPPEDSLELQNSEITETSIISLVDDDDDNESYIDDNVTLDMEVVCADGPGEDSDGIETDNEIPQDVVAIESSPNRGGENSTVGVVHSSSVKNVQITTPREIPSSTEQAGDIPVSVVSYPTLRETLTCDTYKGLLSKQKTVVSHIPAAGPASSAVSTGTSKSITAQPPARTEMCKSDLSKQRTKPRILTSKGLRKTPATLISAENAMVISLDECGGDYEDESGSDYEVNGQDTVSRDASARTAERNVNIESAVDGYAESRQRSVTKEGESTSSEVQRRKVESLVQSRFAAIEKLIKEQLNGMAEDIQRNTEQSSPEHNENRKLKISLEKQKEDYEKKLEDLHKTMTGTLKEALASYNHQKLVLAHKLKDEFNKVLQKAVSDTKRQQWCAECWREAVYYCCWNTSYCSYQCQQKHWPMHMPKCMQAQQQQLQATASQAVSRSPNIISTLNAIAGAGKSKTISTTSSGGSIIVTTTAPASQPTAAVTPMTVAKTAQRLPTVSIVSPSQWKASEEAVKAKKVFSLVSPQTVSNEPSWQQTQQTFTSGAPRQSGTTGTGVQLFNPSQNLQTSTPTSALSFGPTQFQIQYLQQQGSSGTLPQQVQVVGASPSSIPVIMPSLITPSQSSVAPPVQLLHNASVFPLMQRSQQSGMPQVTQPQQIGGTRFIIPSTFGTFMRPGGPV